MFPLLSNKRLRFKNNYLFFIDKYYSSATTTLFLLLHILQFILRYVSIAYEITQFTSQNFILYLFANRIKHISYICILFSTHFEVVYTELC
jgi:hypothetical protein